MNIKRETLVNQLRFASIGLSRRGETLEQSTAFVFTKDLLVTFNDEILTRSKTPLDFTAAIVADDFLKMLEKFPDEEVDISLKGEEVIFKGAKRSAGVTAFSQVTLPYAEAPIPTKWTDLGQGVTGMLQQAARTCGRDTTAELTLVVHVTPDYLEACDNFRLFRATLKTGFETEVLIPATSIAAVGGLDLKQVSVGEGWTHFKTADGHEISMRCHHSKYLDNVDALLKLGDAEEVTLPNNLGEILDRAEVMVLREGEVEPRVGIAIENELLTLTSRKDGGWYKERKKIRYSGPALEFEVNPKFLTEVLTRTRKVLISGGKRMKLEAEGIQFVVALLQKPTE